LLLLQSSWATTVVVVPKRATTVVVVPKRKFVVDPVVCLDHLVVGGGVDDGVFFTALAKELDEFM
jgi:hypothetical protein